MLTPLRPQPPRRAFTLLELIVVIVILSILAALAIPTFKGVISRTQDDSTTSTLRALARDAQALNAFGDTTLKAGALEAITEVRRTPLEDAGAQTPSPSQVLWSAAASGTVALSMRSGSERLCTVVLTATTSSASCGAVTAGAARAALGETGPVTPVLEGVFPAQGTVTTVAGARNQAGYLDAAFGTDARLTAPRSLTAMGGVLYITDTGNNAIRTMDTTSTSVTTLVGGPSSQMVDGPFSTAKFKSLKATVAAGNVLYAADGDGAIRKVDLTSKQVTTLVPERGLTTPSSPNPLLSVYAMAVSGPYLYLGGAGAPYQILRVDTRTGEVSVAVDQAYDYVYGIASDGTNLYFGGMGGRVEKYDMATGTRSTLSDGSYTDASGNVVADPFKDVWQVVLVRGSLYVADTNRVRLVDTGTGRTTTFAGQTYANYVDGPRDTAALQSIRGLALSGNVLYVAEESSNTVRAIR